MSRSEQRVQRLLILVPYVLSHPGTTVTDLVGLFGGSQASLIRDLQTLMMTGMPPFGPGDLVDVEIDDEGEVWVSMADHFSRPLRLTRAEALALYLRGMEVLGAPGLEEAPALTAAMDKLRDALSGELGQVVDRMESSVQPREVGPLALIREAVDAHRAVEIEYYTQGRDAVTTRTIHPEHVFWDVGAWYVIAWDPDAEAERTFRVDRIHDGTMREESFEPRGLAGLGRVLSPTSGDVIVKLHLAPTARWVCEYFQVEVREEHPDGSVDVELTTSHLAWVAKLLLRLGADARIDAPPELRRAVREEAESALARYS